MRLVGSTAGAVLALALAGAVPAERAAAQEGPVTVSAIHVEADVTAIGTDGAAAFWRDLPTDLEDALARELVGMLDAEGLALLVAVDELALTEAYESEFSDGDGRLAGRVQLVEPGSNEVRATYDVAATSRQAEAMFPADVDVVTIDRTSAQFYDAVVGAFARGVAETVRTQ
jgi:hypothetical protein